jgi:hypothetical protein
MPSTLPATASKWTLTLLPSDQAIAAIVQKITYQRPAQPHPQHRVPAGRRRPLGDEHRTDSRAVTVTARRTLVLWLMAMLAGAAIVWHSRFSADMSFFLPAHPSAEQQVLVDQLREGASRAC